MSIPQSRQVANASSLPTTSEMILEGALELAAVEEPVLSLLLSLFEEVEANFEGEFEVDDVTKKSVTVESLLFLAHLKCSKKVN